MESKGGDRVGWGGGVVKRAMREGWKGWAVNWSRSSVVGIGRLLRSDLIGGFDTKKGCKSQSSSTSNTGTGRRVRGTSGEK